MAQIVNLNLIFASASLWCNMHNEWSALLLCAHKNHKPHQTKRVHCCFGPTEHRLTEKMAIETANKLNELWINRAGLWLSPRTVYYGRAKQIYQIKRKSTQMKSNRRKKINWITNSMEIENRCSSADMESIKLCANTGSGEWTSTAIIVSIDVTINTIESEHLLRASMNHSIVYNNTQESLHMYVCVCVGRTHKRRKKYDCVESPNSVKYQSLLCVCVFVVMLWCCVYIQKVAIKSIARGHLSSDTVSYLRDAFAMIDFPIQFENANCVPYFRSGQQQSCPYYVLRYRESPMYPFIYIVLRSMFAYRLQQE